MAEVSLDLDDNEAISAWGLPSTAIPLDQREDHDTITKVNTLVNTLELPPLFPQLVETSLHGRVTTAQDQANAWISSQLAEIDPEHFRAVEHAAQTAEEPEANYMIQIRGLVAKILVQLNRIAEKDRSQMNKLKIEYKILTSKAAQLQKELGENGLFFAGVSLGAALLQFASPYQADRDIMMLISGTGCKNLGEMFGASIQANQQKATALASLILSEYQAKTQKGQSDSSNKQELIGMLDRALQGLTQTARAG